MLGCENAVEFYRTSAVKLLLHKEFHRCFLGGARRNKDERARFTSRPIPLHEENLYLFCTSLEAHGNERIGY